MNGGRLVPQMLDAVLQDFGAILPNHKVTISHVSGSEIGRRRGRYSVTIDGPRFTGRWTFASGELECVSREAAEGPDREPVWDRHLFLPE